MEINKIKSGRPKSTFIIAFEWLTLVTLLAFILLFLSSQIVRVPAVATVALAFVLLLEIGLLSIFYGAEGVRYKIIWLTYPTLSGPRRLGFSGIASFVISAIYILMGLALIFLSIFFVYLNRGITG